MAGTGHVYRHDYEDVAAEFVWETVTRALPSLQAAIDAELERRVSSHTDSGGVDTPSWPGRVPAIHFFAASREPQVVDARVKPGHLGKPLDSIYPTG